jgi:hypothetical protein
MRTDRFRPTPVSWLWIVAISSLATAQAPLPDAALEVKIDSTQAEATLGLLAARARGESVPASSWARVFESEGYKRVLARELAIDERLGIERGYSNDSFLEWALSDAALEGLAGRQRTLAAWADVDLDEAARRARAYLPEGTRLEATAYPIVRKQTNSFVWDLPHDPAIFLSVGADVGAGELALTLAHELHHVGLAGGCAESEEEAEEGVAAARRWLSGFGEGLAVLAAAGGPEGETHAPGQVDLGAAWRERLENLESDMQDLEAFLIDVAEGRTVGEEAQRRGMAFVSADDVPQGAFYSVGWFMAVAVERHLGREAVVAAACDHGRLLTDYQRVARGGTGLALPSWSDRLLKVLGLVGVPTARPSAPPPTAPGGFGPTG